MRMYDIIAAKRDGKVLTKEQIAHFTRGLADDSIPDYQISALLMAMYLNGLQKEELEELTLQMAASGEMCDLGAIPGIKVDKHSTGGVGDKTSLITLPIVAACGAPVAKMSGRGLGHTGGTIDKLGSIVGMRTDLSTDALVSQVKEIGICIAAQNARLCPADKKLYALRDVTATVESIPLIASSIMSKKLASGADKILLDVKCGSGALVESVESAVSLARTMVEIANHAGKEAIALITSMDAPLGYAVGNALEVTEAIDVLQGNGAADLVDICIALSDCMLELAGIGSSTLDRRALILEKVNSGEALAKFLSMIRCQGGKFSADGMPLFITGKSKASGAFAAPLGGHISKMDTRLIGVAALTLGAGRETKEDDIDYMAGLLFHKKTGDKVAFGEVIAQLTASDSSKIEAATQILAKAITISADEPTLRRHILGKVSMNGVELFEA